MDMNLCKDMERSDQLSFFILFHKLFISEYIFPKFPSNILLKLDNI